MPKLPQLQHSRNVSNIRITAQAIASPTGGIFKTCLNSWLKATLCTRFAIPLPWAASLARPGCSLQSPGKDRCMGAAPASLRGGHGQSSAVPTAPREHPPRQDRSSGWVQMFFALPHPASVRCDFPRCSGNIVGRLARRVTHLGQCLGHKDHLGAY